MSRARSAARAALIHLNLLLAVFAGGVLVLWARLCWDPTLYVVVRELWPLEYRWVVAALPVTAGAQLALVHTGTAAARARSRTAICMLWTYASGSVFLLAGAAGLAWAVRCRAVHWMDTPAAARVRRLTELPAKLQPALVVLADWVPHTDAVNDVLKEAEADLPKNARVAMAAAAMYAVAVLTASALAVTLALGVGRRKYHGVPHTMMKVRTLPEP